MVTNVKVQDERTMLVEIDGSWYELPTDWPTTRAFHRRVRLRGLGRATELVTTDPVVLYLTVLWNGVTTTRPRRGERVEVPPRKAAEKLLRAMLRREIQALRGVPSQLRTVPAWVYRDP